MTDTLTSETLDVQLTRFGERILYVLTNDSSAMAIYRMVVAEAGLACCFMNQARKRTSISFLN